MALRAGVCGMAGAGEGARGRVGGVRVAGEEEGEGEEEEEARARLKETVRGVAEKGPERGGRREGGEAVGLWLGEARGEGDEEAASVEGVVSRSLWGLGAGASSELESSLGVRAGGSGDISEATKE